MTSKFLGLLGLCAKGGMLIYGSALACDAAKANKCAALLLASDASGNTADRIRRVGTEHKTAVITLPHTQQEISAATGRTGTLAALAITNRGMTEQIIALIGQQNG